ncbi:MAG: hypothetical protein ABFD89_26220 [Bryobacteraceae bacterium]
MSKFTDSELSQKIDDAIVEHLQSGEPTADEVSQEVLSQYDHLIRQYGYDLAVSQIRSIVSGRMKKILATRKGHALQLRLGMKFGNLEPESAITFRDRAGAIRYVATARATAEHHQRYIELLGEQIKADTERLVAAEMFFSWLEPAFRMYPGISTAEAIAVLEPEGQAA